MENERVELTDEEEKKLKREWKEKRAERAPEKRAKEKAERTAAASKEDGRKKDEFRPSPDTAFFHVCGASSVYSIPAAARPVSISPRILKEIGSP